MNKKLLAVAVAGAFVPAIASAQVTVSGKFGVQLINLKISNPNAARAGLNTRGWAVSDNVTTINIGAREDLGGGMEAFGQYQLRPLMDQAVGDTGSGDTNHLSVGSQTGISYVGIRSNAWGSLRFGTDETWGARGSGLSTSASQQYSSSPILTYITTSAATGTATSFSSGRQQNLIIYDTPTFGGLKVTVAYSTNPNAADNDFQAVGRKGSAWYLMPEYTAGGWKVGYAYADLKQDAPSATTATPAPVTATNPLDVKANKLYVETSLAGIEFGLTYAKVTAKSGFGLGAVTAGTKVADVAKWLLPVRYRSGNNTFGFMYGRSNDDKVVAGDQRVVLTALSYNYNFSRRTNAGLSWARLKNSAGAAYDLSGTTSAAYSFNNSSTTLGEDQSVIAFSLNHSF